MRPSVSENLPPSTLDAIGHLFAAAQAGQGSFVEPIMVFLQACEARAVGLWQRQGNDLIQLGYASCPDMAPDVHRDFSEGTKKVSLSQTGLGIVRATLTKEPAVATLEPEKTGLPGSAGWLARFGALESLACPILIPNGEVGWVFAVSAAYRFEPGNPHWNTVTGVAERLGHLLIPPTN